MDKLSLFDFQLYQSQPIHLWAKFHHQFVQPTSLRPFSLNQQIKTLGIEYIKKILMPNFKNSKLNTNIKFATEKIYSTIDAHITTDEGDEVICAIKASTNKNKRFIDQLTFQAQSLKKSPKRLFLILLNPRYTRLNELDLDQLFFVTEVTTEVFKSNEYIKEKIDDALKIIKLETPDSLDACINLQTCPCKELCHPNIPEFSIYDAIGLKQTVKNELKRKNILNILDIPKEYLIEKRLIKQINFIKNQTIQFDTGEIKKHLSQLVFPISFLDYEAYAFPKPLFPGYWPQSSVVFQYSLQILNEDGSIISKDFLHTITDNPTKHIIKFLKKDLPEKGSIVVWDQGLESQVHGHLARLQTQDMLFLLGLNQRFFDLQNIFKEGLYQDYRFKGSYSLKKILPILVPEYDYKNLEISSGLEAATHWYSLVFDSTSKKNSNKIKKSLIEYCQLDTLGCLKIYQKLINL